RAQVAGYTLEEVTVSATVTASGTVSLLGTGGSVGGGGGLSFTFRRNPVAPSPGAPGPVGTDA
ncbi:MAG TPA: hypothetical protein VFT95_18430, partial [Micromonosporaceae bacterium]|nr:hypothetical protein [Micromonosporaceae bacterium]